MEEDEGMGYPLFTAGDLEAFVELLKEWPNSAFGNDESEISVSPFVSLYFSYDPAAYVATTQAMIDVHADFESLLGAPYTIATHPISERRMPMALKEFQI